MKLWKHVLKVLHEFNGTKVSAPELAREIDRIGEYEGPSQDLGIFTGIVRAAVEECRKWGYVARETQERKFGGGIGSTPKHFYSIKPEGIRVLEHEGMI